MLIIVATTVSKSFNKSSLPSKLLTYEWINFKCRIRIRIAYLYCGNEPSVAVSCNKKCSKYTKEGYDNMACTICYYKNKPFNTDFPLWPPHYTDLK